MKAIIIEDEVIAAQSLQQLITEVDPSIQITSTLQSIDESIEWFHSNAMPDLVFMDIHLADGSSFNILDEVDISCPIIFTTAYDEYALKAFNVNGIAYLLKPINKADLERAITKLKKLSASPSENIDAINKLLSSFKEYTPTYRSYFLVPKKDKLIPLATADIAYIYIDAKLVKAVTFSDKSYYLDQTLDELVAQLNPKLFFRANRQYIVARKAVKDLTLWFGSKLIVNLTIQIPEKIVVSKAKTSEMKKWVAG